MIQTNMTYEIKEMEIIDNRNRQEFADYNWWAVIYFTDGTDALMAFRTKRDAKWFINGGYNEFILK
jgi:hypothetical protein